MDNKTDLKELLDNILTRSSMDTRALHLKLLTMKLLKGVSLQEHLDHMPTWPLSWRRRDRQSLSSCFVPLCLKVFLLPMIKASKYNRPTLGCGEGGTLDRGNV